MSNKILTIRRRFTQQCYQNHKRKLDRDIVESCKRFKKWLQTRPILANQGQFRKLIIILFHFLKLSHRYDAQCRLKILAQNARTLAYKLSILTYEIFLEPVLQNWTMNRFLRLGFKFKEPWQWSDCWRINTIKIGKKKFIKNVY